jgi:hypothetical protein
MIDLNPPVHVPEDAIERIRSRVLHGPATRSPSRRRSAIVAVALAASLVALVTPSGRSAIAFATDAAQTLDAFIAGGDAPGTPVGGATEAAFLADFTNARPGTARVLATTPDGQQLVAVKTKMQYGFAYACFDFGHSYADCSPVGQSDLFKDGPIAMLIVTKSLTPDRGTLWGLVSDDVARVELRYADGGSITEAVSNGIAITFDPARQPTELLALNADGQVLGKADSELRLQVHNVDG